MNEKKQNGVAKGDVFQTSWGYDQTNYDFIIVESVSPTGKTVICKRAYVKRIIENSSMTEDALKPTTEGYGLPFRMKVDIPTEKDYGFGNVYLRGSYPFLSRFEETWNEEQQKNWLNSKRLGGFSKIETGRNYYQTNPMFGH